MLAPALAANSGWNAAIADGAWESMRHRPVGVSPMTLDQIASAVATPVETLRLLDKLDAEERLADFVRLMWSIIDPAPLVWSWPMDAICEHLEAVTRGEIRDLLINVPPGFSKSRLVNVMHPAWEWGPKNRPDLKYVSWSYSEKLTQRDNRYGRLLILSDLYQSLWGDRFQLAEDQNAKGRYDTDKNGFRIATSIGGMGTGERADRRIVDDPHSVKQAESDAEREAAVQWFAETYPTRVTNPKTSSSVVIMQRLHKQDVAGHIIDHQLGYEHLLIEMEWEGADHPMRRTVHWRTSSIGYEDPRTEPGELASPERYDAAAVAKMKREMESAHGPYATDGQLRQYPTSREGGLFKEAWFGKIIPLHEVPRGGRTVRSWDFAGSTGKRSPYTASVLQRLVNGNLYILDVTCERIEAAGLEDHVVEVTLADPIDVESDFPQDPGQAGKAQVASLARRLHGRTFHSSPESGSKETRAKPVASQYRAGNAYLVEGPWARGFIAEHVAFPASTFKDRVDAGSRGYAQLVSRPERGIIRGGSELIVPS